MPRAQRRASTQQIGAPRARAARVRDSAARDESSCFGAADGGLCGMSFGHWVEIVEGSVRLGLGSIPREEAATFFPPERKSSNGQM